jgi:predicted nucleic acid-binding protein
LPEFPALRVYLDSNVVFSASRDQRSRFLELWRLRDIAVVISQYVVGEVSRNINSIGHNQRFESLLAQTEFVSDADVQLIPANVGLVEKDRPILAAAIAASVDYLITGDKSHFGHLYGTRVSGVYVISPADFLGQYEDRLPD